LEEMTSFLFLDEPPPIMHHTIWTISIQHKIRFLFIT
jgi:hypothetical protein